MYEIVLSLSHVKMQELCTHGCLMDVLKANKLRYLQRLEMAYDVMCAVEHMHTCGFVHR